MTVLSIDIDSMFNGHTYHKHTNFNVSPSLSWDIIDMIKSEDNKIDTEIDRECLNMVANILESKCKKAKFRYIEEHDEIYNIMKEYNCKNSTVYNVDAHLDIDYGNDNNELTIENWVLHCKNEHMLNEYHWICRPFSDIHTNVPFKYYRTCYTDVVVDNMKEIDLVVICTSKHFTPKKYWDSLPNILLSYKDIKGWQEVTPNTLDIDKIKDMKEYTIDGSLPNITRLFRKDNGYIVLEDRNISMLCLANNMDMFTIKHVVDYLLEEYGKLYIDYIIGSPNEVFIKRLIRNYQVGYNSISDSNIKSIEIKLIGEWLS